MLPQVVRLRVMNANRTGDSIDENGDPVTSYRMNLKEVDLQGKPLSNGSSVDWNIWVPAEAAGPTLNVVYEIEASQ